MLSIFAFILGILIGLILNLAKLLLRIKIKIILNGFKGHLRVIPAEKKPLTVLIPKTEVEEEKEEADSLWKSLYRNIFNK